MSIYGKLYPQLQISDPLVGNELMAVWQTGVLKRVTVDQVASAGSTVVGNIYISGSLTSGTVPILSYAEYGGVFMELDGVAVSSGTATVSIQINGVNVTGLTALSITTTPQNFTATAANTFTTGDRIALVYTASGSNLEATAKLQRS